MKRLELILIVWSFLIANSILVYTNVTLFMILIAILIELFVMAIYMSHQIIDVSVIKFIAIFGSAWILMLPFGGLGISGYLFAHFPFPETIMRPIILHRILTGIPLAVLYLILIVTWWLQTRKVTIKTSAKWTKTAVVTIILSVVVLLVLCQVNIKQTLITDNLMALMVMLFGTLAVASLMGTIVYEHFKLNEYNNYKNRGNVLLVITMFLMVIIGGFSQVMTNDHQGTKPIVVAHRGVDHQNGVQNSVQSLKKTGKYVKYIEMDIQMSEDQQFVLMHDPSLKKLADNNQTISNDNMAELKKVKLHENGFVVPLSTFDTYFKVADQQANRLIIELKPQKIDPKLVVFRFNQMYGNHIIKSRAVVHSIDYELISNLKNINPKISVGLIRPFMVTKLPTKGITFYTLNSRTINRTIVDQLHHQHKKVYVWTVDDKETARRMAALGVDGIITNRSKMVQNTLNQKLNIKTETAKNIIWQLI